ncbi:MAG TPA: succinate dehydrogenase cytochrome b558 subunit [Pirellulaceae bacterium]|nr:succinate dehydrogenase cytochrome b558 subunit [Pirellulaceae bacterium]
MKSESAASSPPSIGSPSFLERNEFLLRRLHSLSGIIPVGAYMVIHLLTNATVLDKHGTTFQRMVYQIHSLPFLLAIEWTFIFLPIIFHAVYGIVIVRTGMSNVSNYPYRKNWRYTLQRATGMIAFLFIFWHVFHMHGWIHSTRWLEAIAGWGGMFEKYNATSSAAAAMQASILIPIFYTLGVLSCVFHLANGIWTFGITWGLWTTPLAQRRADYACIGFGVVLALVSLGAIGGFATADVKTAKEAEDKVYNAKVASGEIAPDEHQRAKSHGGKEQATLPVVGQGDR